jgi:hypothetical protein
MTEKYFRSQKRGLLLITCLSMMGTWLPLLRGLFDGPSYRWGNTLFGMSFSGNGIDGDYYFVVVNAVVGFLLLYTFYHTHKRVLFYTLLALWYITVVGNVCWTIFAGEGLYFHGDTLGVHLNLGYVVLPMVALLTVWVTWLVATDPRYGKVYTWKMKNNRWLIVVLAMLPVQFFLLRTGEPHGLTDKIGVVMALSQLVIFYWVFKGYGEDNFRKE